MYFQRRVKIEKSPESQMAFMKIETQRIEVIDDTMAEILRHKTHAERLNIAFHLWSSTTRLLASFISSAHPEWDEPTVQKEVARRMSYGTV